MPFVRVEGLEELDALLSDLESIDMGEVAERAAERLRAEITPGVPWKTGRLRRSGRVEAYPGMARLVWDDVVYAAIVEARKPYFYPVIEARGEDVLTEELAYAIDEVLRRNA